MTDTDKGIIHHAHMQPTPSGKPTIYDGQPAVRFGYGSYTILGCSNVNLTDQEVIETFGYAVSLVPFEQALFGVQSSHDGKGTSLRNLSVAWNDPRLEAVLAEVQHSRWALYQRTLKPEWTASLEALSTMADNAEREDLMIHPEQDGITLNYLTLAKKYLDRIQKAHEKNPGSVYLRNLYDEAVAEVCRLIVISPKGYVLGSIYKTPTEPTNP